MAGNRSIGAVKMAKKCPDAVRIWAMEEGFALLV